MVDPEQLQAEVARLRRQLDAYAARFRNIVEKNADGLIVVDAEGIVRFVSPAAEAIFERPADGLRGTEFGFPVVAGESTELDVIRPGGRTIAVEMRVATTEWDGATACIASLRDVTERKQMEAALREAHDALRALFEASPLAIFARDAAGTVTSWNPAAERMFGLSADDVIGRTVGQIFPARDAELLDLWERVRAGQVVADHEARYATRDGRDIDLSISAAPLYDASGRVGGMMVMLADVTARREMEERVRRSQRLEMAGRIASQVAHDFNNLLQPLVGYPALIKRRLPEGHPAIGYCETMIRLARQLAKINDDLLTLGRRGHFERAPTDLNAVVEQAIAELGKRFDVSRVKLNLAPSLAPVNGAEAQLLRVVTNLVANGLDATEAGGEVVVTTEQISVDSPDGIYNRVGVGEYARLQVADGGCGIPPEVRDQIFDAFFTTKRTDQQRGSGLGLTVVQAVVEDHGGVIDFASEPGRGTTFSIYLPVCRARPAPPPASVRGGSETILICDDDEPQRTVVAQMLESLGYRTRVAGSGEEAVDLLREQAVDLIVLDMVMPGGIDGAETYRRARKRRPGLPAIVVSGFAESARARAALALGAGAFVRKPVTLEALAAAVRRELDRGRKTKNEKRKTKSLSREAGA